MYEYNSEKKDENNYTYDLDEIKIPDKIYKCKKICLKPSFEQTKLLLNMLEGYRLVYNSTVKFINERNYLYNKQQKELKAEELKAEELKVKKRRKLTKEEKEQKEAEKLLKIKKKEEKNRLKEISKMQRENKPVKKTKEEELKEIEEKQKRRLEKIQNITQENNYEQILDYQIIRTYFLKNIISDIANEYKTPIHCLDKAVALACASFKSAISNCKNGNIKFFKIRPIKNSKSSLMMDIEKSLFTKDKKSFIKSILGNEVLNKGNKEYDIKNDCKIHYNKSTKKFILLVPEIVTIEKENKNKNNYISIDPGLRTFLNCTTDKSYIEIGTNIRDKLKKELNKIDKIEEHKKGIRKRRYLKIMRNKIKNQVNDSHWKIIDYLTTTYKTIIIGKWSTKSIISKKNKVLCNLDKRVVQTLSFFQFTQKLKYRCLIKNVNLKIIEEHYTSKMCTSCGNLKKDLGGNDSYCCEKCNLNIKRDYNGARNIFLKSIKELNI